MGLQLTFYKNTSVWWSISWKVWWYRSQQSTLSLKSFRACRTNICIYSCRHSLNTLSPYRHNTYFVIRFKKTFIENIAIHILYEFARVFVNIGETNRDKWAHTVLHDIVDMFECGTMFMLELSTHLLAASCVSHCAVQT